MPQLRQDANSHTERELKFKTEIFGGKYQVSKGTEGLSQIIRLNSKKIYYWLLVMKGTVARKIQKAISNT